MRTLLHFVTILIAIGLFAACNGSESSTVTHGLDQDAEENESRERDRAERTSPWSDLNEAVCVLVPTEGNNVSGVIRFVTNGKNVTITADISGLQANAQHAFHIHEFGDLTAGDGTSAGGHYNPEGHDHGLLDQEHRHAGDLGNLQTDENGVAHYELTVDNISVAGRRNPIIGRSVIVHADVDDGGQPTGNAGARIAMGVIGIAKSSE